jgi:hypothetical protein
MNSIEWDLLVDRDLALAAETASQEKAKESKAKESKAKESKDDADIEKAISLADTPYAESVRLGHDLYVIPGDYTVRVSVGENNDNIELKVRAPKDFRPRVKQAYKLRGKKD